MLLSFSVWLFIVYAVGPAALAWLQSITAVGSEGWLCGLAANEMVPALIAVENWIEQPHYGCRNWFFQLPQCLYCHDRLRVSCRTGPIKLIFSSVDYGRLLFSFFFQIPVALVMLNTKDKGYFKFSRATNQQTCTSMMELPQGCSVFN